MFVSESSEVVGGLLQFGLGRQTLKPLGAGPQVEVPVQVSVRLTVGRGLKIDVVEVTVVAGGGQPEILPPSPALLEAAARFFCFFCFLILSLFPLPKGLLPKMSQIGAEVGSGRLKGLVSHAGRLMGGKVGNGSVSVGLGCVAPTGVVVVGFPAPAEFDELPGVEVLLPDRLEGPTPPGDVFGVPINDGLPVLNAEGELLGLAVPILCSEVLAGTLDRGREDSDAGIVQ